MTPEWDERRGAEAVGLTRRGRAQLRLQGPGSPILAVLEPMSPHSIQTEGLGLACHVETQKLEMGLAIDHDDVDSWADGSGGETCWHDRPAGLIV